MPPQFLGRAFGARERLGERARCAADGSATYNLFGVKAGRSWRGPSVELQTTEYVDGVAQTVRERFRVYGSYAEAFRDYANLLRTSPRFAPVLGQQDGTKFAGSLQQSGYATDPLYADKLSRISMGRRYVRHWRDKEAGLNFSTYLPLTATKERVRHEHRIHQLTA